MSTAILTQTLFSLPVAERVALADRLYASVPDEWQKHSDQAWLDESARRSSEMDLNPEMELTHEEFLAGIQIKKPDA